jgi:hypothetical protein
MPENEVVLKSVPREKAFYFYSDIGNYTGKSAASLKEFAETVELVDVKSLEFHLRRGDFESWIIGVLKDEELTKQVRDELRVTNLRGEDLRKRLHSIISARLEQLKHTPVPTKISDSKVEVRWGRNVTR